MTEHKFTPGPWWVLHEGSSEITVQTDGESICELNFDPLPKEETEKHLANANLIAAAPEMFAFIEKLVNQIEENGLMQYDRIHNGENWVLEEAKESLRKARGESEVEE